MRWSEILNRFGSEIETRGLIIGGLRLKAMVGSSLLRWSVEHGGCKTEDDLTTVQEIIEANEKFLSETEMWPITALFDDSGE